VTETAKRDGELTLIKKKMEKSSVIPRERGRLSVMNFCYDRKTGALGLVDLTQSGERTISMARKFILSPGTP